VFLFVIFINKPLFLLELRRCL